VDGRCQQLPVHMALLNATSDHGAVPVLSSAWILETPSQKSAVPEVGVFS
jgi:hypothetical protein